MKRLTKTKLVALAIVAGATTGALAQKKSVRFDPLTKDVYRLTYLNHDDYNIKVEVVDESGIMLLSEQIRQKKSFTKSYNFQYLDIGEYSFKVTDADGEYVTKIRRTDEEFMEAVVMKIDDNKVKVVVRGEFMRPVSVNFLDGNDHQIFSDYIDQAKGFSRIYDISKVMADNLSIEVVTEKKLLATNEF